MGLIEHCKYCQCVWYYHKLPLCHSNASIVSVFDSVKVVDNSLHILTRSLLSDPPYFFNAMTQHS